MGAPGMPPSLVKVRVRTSASSESIRRVGEEGFEVSVREKPQGNLANARVLALVAREIGVPVKKVRIIKGHHRPSKLLSVAR